MCPVSAATVPQEAITMCNLTLEALEYVLKLTGVSRRYLVALPGIEPGFED